MIPLFNFTFFNGKSTNTIRHQVCNELFYNEVQFLLLCKKRSKRIHLCGFV